MADNLFTAYMDYLRFMDSYNKPAAPVTPPTMTAEKRAKLDAAIAEAVNDFCKAETARSKAEKGGK